MGSMTFIHFLPLLHVLDPVEHWQTELLRIDTFALFLNLREKAFCISLLTVGLPITV
jgi:hypothetical protein